MDARRPLLTRSQLRDYEQPSARRKNTSSASSELGEFESGLTAQLFGAVPAVVLGGLGTLLVVLLRAWRFPKLGRVDRLEDAVAPD